MEDGEAHNEKVTISGDDVRWVTVVKVVKPRAKPLAPPTQAQAQEQAHHAHSHQLLASLLHL